MSFLEHTFKTYISRTQGASGRRVTPKAPLEPGQVYSLHVGNLGYDGVLRSNMPHWRGMVKKVALFVLKRGKKDQWLPNRPIATLQITR